MDPSRLLSICSPSFSKSPSTKSSSSSSSEIYSLFPYSQPLAPFSGKDIRSTLSVHSDQSDHSTNQKNVENPFTEIARNMFNNPEAIELANLDAVFDLTKYHGGYIAKQTFFPFVFIDLSPSTLGFTEYLQWRMARSFGYGLTTRTDPTIDRNYFNITTGKDETANIKTNYSYMVKWFQEFEPLGADLLVVKNNLGSELSLFEYLIPQIYVALETLKPGADLVLQIFETRTFRSKALLYLLAQTFDEIHLFKAFSSRVDVPERYIVAKRKHAEVQDAIRCLKQVLALNKKATVTDLFKDYPPKFTEWFIEVNRIQSEAIDDQVYNYNRCLALWNLPSFRPHLDPNTWTLLDKPCTLRFPPIDVAESIETLTDGRYKIHRVDGSIYYLQPIKDRQPFIKAHDIAEQLKVQTSPLEFENTKCLALDLPITSKQVLITDFISDEPLLEVDQVKDKKEFVEQLSRIIVLDILCANTVRFPLLFDVSEKSVEIRDIVVADDGKIYAQNNIYKEKSTVREYKLWHMVQTGNFDEIFWNRLTRILNNLGYAGANLLDFSVEFSRLSQKVGLLKIPSIF